MSSELFTGRAKMTQNLSTYLIMAFAILVLGSATFSEIFQNRNSKENLTELYNNPFNISFLDTLHTIKLENDITQLTLQKDQDWQMISPKRLKAQKRAISKITQTLHGIEIKKIYQKEPINIRSFSLDKPRVILELQGNQTYTIRIGLINPIDNSTYLSIDEFDTIYKISNPINNIANIDLTSFIDARVFPFDSEEVKSFKIFKKQQKSPQLSFIKGERGWANHQGRGLNQQKVEQFIKKLLAIESTAILDKQSQENESLLKRYSENQQYRIEIETENHNQVFIITPLIKQLPDIKFEKFGMFSVIPEDSGIPKLVKKEHFWNFSQNDAKYRSLPVKKMIY